MPADKSLMYLQAAVHAAPAVLTATVATRRIAFTTFVAEEVIGWHEPSVYTGDYEQNKAKPAQTGRIVNVSLSFPFQADDFGMFQTGVLGQVTPSTVDTNGKQRLNLSTNKLAKDIYTFEYFDGDQVWIINGVAWKTMSLTVNGQGEIMCTFTGYGQKKVTGAAASLAQSVTQPIESWQKILYKNAVGVAPTVALDGTLNSATITIDNQCVPQYGGNNSQFITFFTYRDWRATCSMNWWMSSAALENANFQAGTALSLAVALQGPVCTASVYQGMTFKFAGMWRTYQHTENNGGNALALTWIPAYDTVLAYGFSLGSVNLIASY